MPARIKDEFSGKLKADGAPMSRQQIYRLRKRARNLCPACGEPAVGFYCLKHTVTERERMRRKLSSKRRFTSARSYVMAQLPAGERKKLVKKHYAKAS
jgi:hypothetical protein